MIPQGNSFLFVLWLLQFSFVEGFYSTSSISGLGRSGSRKVTDICAFMDEANKFLEDFGNNNEASNAVDAEIVDDDGYYTGSKRMITIPAKTMKQGGLRLYCNLYLMGLQNTPEKGSWKASKSDNSEVNLRYVDISGSIIIRFEEDAITVDRLGSSPSMQYLAAESVVLNGFLDEIQAIVYDGDIAEGNRLLTLNDASILQNARSVVSF